MTWKEQQKIKAALIRLKIVSENLNFLENQIETELNEIKRDYLMPHVEDIQKAIGNLVITLTSLRFDETGTNFDHTLHTLTKEENAD